jgi:hypothetical protein
MKKLTVCLLFFALAAQAATPETVAVTYRVKPGNEAELQKVLARQWATLTRLDAVTGPHSLYRGEGFFLEIFTWKDAAIPDNAPAEIRTIWGEMHKLTDKIQIEEVHAIE